MEKEMTLKELQQVSLDIMKDIHRFCVENNIRYSLGGGSLIGAIRHRGFIPWDDDMDVFMPRPDYERFRRTYKSDDYKFLCHEDNHSDLMLFGRVCDFKRTITHQERPWSDEMSGVWIDVFPIDGTEDDESCYLKVHKKLQRMCKPFYKFRRQNHHIQKGDSWWSVTKTYLAKIIGLNGLVPHLMFKWMYKIETRVDYDKANYWVLLSFLNPKPLIRNRKDETEPYVLADFEDAQFYIYKGYDVYLRHQFGDYMQLPPEEERQPKQYWIKFCWKDNHK